MPFGSEALIIFTMLVFNAIFAAFEMALASIARSKLVSLSNSKRKGAADALFMKDHMEASFAVVQLGITFFGAIAAAAGGVGVSKSLSPYLELQFGWSKTLADVVSLLFLIIPLSLFTIIFSELIPKTYALKNKVWICLGLAPFMRGLFRVGYPIILLIERIVKKTVGFINKKMGLRGSRLEDQVDLHELIAAVSLARTSRLIGAREEKIVLSAAQLSVRPVREIILPVADISMIPIDSTLADALIKAHLDMHTRFPVCVKENDPQTIQGYVNFKDIMMALKLNPNEPSIKGIVRPIKTVVETTPISQVLEQMMQEKLHIALVGSNDGRIIGMITLEDIIEEMVGEIEDEFDRLPTHIHPYGGGWIIGGGVPMKVVVQTTGITTLTNESLETYLKLADWCALKIPHPLVGGEMFDSDGLHVIVRKLRRKKVGEAIISVIGKT